MPSQAEFIDIGAIDYLVGLVGVDPGEWWLLIVHMEKGEHMMLLLVI